MRHGRWRLVAVVPVLAAVASCTGDPAPGSAETGASTTAEEARPLVYAAVGASETAGVGTDDPTRDAWPRVLWRTLPDGSVLFDFGVAGSTTSQAMREQVGAAAAVEPDVVTVWLNVNDLLDGVGAARFGEVLQRAVHRLRRGGDATVLVANTPRLDTLPLYLACRSRQGRVTTTLGDAVDCPADLTITLPPPAEIRAAVDAYNREIERVVREEGAVLVDLHGLGDLPSERPELVSEDGFHPSTEGAATVAAAFADALLAAGS